MAEAFIVVKGSFHLPRGTVTFLFTDLEGSTRLWARHPDRMPDALVRHDAILHRVIEARGGRVFKTIGDAVCAAFDRTGDALGAALDAQRALAAETWPLPDPLRARIAIHAGPAEPRAGDYVGLTVNAVARLLAAGHGEQILVSGSARELARDRLPPDTAVRDLGEHALRDLPQPMRVYQLLAPDLPAESPPLRTLGARPHRLPPRPTPLVGREDERLQAGGFLRDGVRLLTLTGPGGTGKTRLAIELANDLLEEFQGEVHFVSLAPVRDPSLVPATVATTLGLREEGGRDPLDDLESELGDRRALLVLDNFEQVMAAAPFVAGLLDAAPQIKVLATSRAPLRLRGEQEFPVPPLPFPEHGLPGVEVLSNYGAVRLFAERARAVKPTFDLTEQNASAVVEICRRVDGLPLAIELAAARIRLLSPQAMLERLGDRLAILTGGPRDLPDRHRSLKATIAWSYDLLPTAEQAVFRRLGVFERGSTIEAAEAVIGADGVLEGLSALVDENLLVQREEPDGEVRFGMLETIREFALEMLAEHGELEPARERHAAYFRALAGSAEDELQGERQNWWMERLAREHPNIRAAIRFSLDRGDVETGLTIAASVWRFWWVHGHMTEGRRWIAEGLAAGGDLDPVLRALGLRAAGGLAWMQSDHDEAIRLLEESLAIDRAGGDDRAVARTLSNLAGVYSDNGDFDRALALIDESVAIDTARNDRHGLAFGWGSRALVHERRAEFPQAIDSYERSLALHREVGDRHSVAITVHNLGETARRMGRFDEARRRASEGLVLFRALEARHGIGYALLVLGDVARHTGDRPEALARYREALEIFRELEYRREIGLCLAGIGLAAAADGESNVAVRLLSAASAQWRTKRLPVPPEIADEIEDVRRALEVELGAEPFDVEWTLGRTLSPDEAIHLAEEAGAGMESA